MLFVQRQALGQAAAPDSRQAGVGVTGQLVLLQAAQRAKAAHAAAVAAAARAAAARAAAARAAALRAAAVRAAAQRAAQRQAAAQAAARAAAQAAASQAAAQAQQADAQQQQAAAQPAPQPAVTASTPAPPAQAPSGSAQEIAQQLLAARGWAGQFSCLDSLWEHESGWNMYAENPSSGAYGIPQALPGSKMASAGSDWQTDAATQIRWGLNYIGATYGTPCGAWSHEESYNWY